LFVAGDDDLLGVQLFDAVLEHGAVGFVEDVGADLDYVVGADAQDVAVESGVVEFTQGDAIGHDGQATGVAVGDDVGGVEEFRVFETAQGALLLVRPDYFFAKGALVQPGAHGGGDVDPSGFGGVFGHGKGLLILGRLGIDGPGVVGRYCEGEGIGIVADDEYGPDGQVAPLDDAVEVDEGDLVLHGTAQADVVSVMGICAAIAIEQEAVRGEAVVVWPIRSGGDG